MRRNEVIKPTPRPGNLILGSLGGQGLQTQNRAYVFLSLGDREVAPFAADGSLLEGAAVGSVFVGHP